jgi:dihydrofolate synthase/folylpolyglutamate synthase
MNVETAGRFESFGSFEEARRYLADTTNYERMPLSPQGYSDFKLDRMRAFCRWLGDPQERAVYLHVAGSKGKGSTSRFLARILQEAGFRTGLYTSPHLRSALERIEVDGSPIDEKGFVDGMNRLLPYLEETRTRDPEMKPTFFEILTALAFECFRQRRIDWGVAEVGLGGRLDATNVLLPRAVIITSLGLEHTHVLGDTLEKIALEKAGIFKEGVPVFSALQPPEAERALRGAAGERGCPLYCLGREFQVSRAERVPGRGWRFDLETSWGGLRGIELGVLGVHQVENAALAAGALLFLRSRGELSVSDGAILYGLAATRQPGRVELFPGAPAVLVDSAHTVESVRALRRVLEEERPGSIVTMIFACQQDKNLAGMLREILPVICRAVVTRTDNPRARDPEEIHSEIARLSAVPVDVEPDPARALEVARGAASKEGAIVVAGSFYLAGEVRGLLVIHPPPSTSSPR